MAKGQPKILSDDEYIKKGEKAVKNPLNRSIKENNDLYDSKADLIKKTYNTQIFEQNSAYESQYRENAVQKAVNERQVSESMANLGLNKSGLNTLQQKAVKYSYLNNNESITKQRKAGIKSIETTRDLALEDVEQNRKESEKSIRSNYSSLANEYANSYKEADVENYNNYIQYQTEQYNKNLAGSYIIKADGATLSNSMKGTLNDNNITVTTIVKNNGTLAYKYVDNNSGNSTVFDRGVNPFTGDYNGDINSNTDTKKAYFKYKTFQNGYQPKGVFYNGKDYGKVSHYEKGGGYVQDYINGNLQYIHKTLDGSLWIWDRNNNMYVPYED